MIIELIIISQAFGASLAGDMLRKPRNSRLSQCIGKRWPPLKAPSLKDTLSLDDEHAHLLELGNLKVT
jgi:hypothetical protein